MRLPAVINYPIGERVVFRAGPHTESFPAKYVVRKGNNTAWLTKEDSDGSERTILAGTSQIAPFASPTTAAPDLVTAKSTTDGTTTTGVAEQTSTCVSSRGPSLVVGVPAQEVCTSQETEPKIQRLHLQVAMNIGRGMLYILIYAFIIYCCN